MTENNVTIIVPVYADWPSLKDCIISLKENVNTSHHKIIFVNDCGPEVDSLESNIKDSIRNRENVYYYRNPKNLGFIKTCNRAVLELDKTDNDILLLNSDTKATEGFLDEMKSIIAENSRVGTVTPRSNNATLATVPLSAAKQKGIDPKKSYELWQKIKNKLPRYNEVPTAHGFCMLVRRSVIKEYGLFDEVFGKGYGEENDFCMRIRQYGYKNVLSNRSFVFHLEAKSFSLETKNKLLEKNLKILYSRHPEYRKLVGEYMEKAIKREAEIEKSVGFSLEGDTKATELKYKKSLSYRAARKIYRKLRSL